MLATSRKKQVVQTLTDSEAEAVFAEYAIASSQIKKINAEMELQFTAIRDKVADKLTVLEKTREEKFNLLQQYALANPQLFEKRKSLEMTHGVIGYRTGTPKLKLLPKFKWETVTELLEKFLKDYVRVKKEPAKELLLADRDVPAVKEFMPKCGIAVVQDETFYIEPKEEETK